MKYALLIYGEEKARSAPDSTEMQEIMGAYKTYTQELNEAGINLGGEALQGVETATTVRVRDGKTLTTDGPFAETKEQLGGFYLVEAPDLDAAIDLAARLPGSWHGSVEVRPIWEFPTTMD